MPELHVSSALIVLLKISLAWGIESSTCGQLPQYNSPHLTHSNPARHWPWHAAIFHRHDNSEPSYECGGTVISQNWILTACHCVFRNHVHMKPEEISVSLGRLNLSADENRSEQIFNVTKIIRHENYDPRNLENDIALVQLSHAATFNYFVRPICIWQSNTDLSSVTDKYGTVVGWGITETFELSKVLQEAHFEVVSHAQCLLSNRDFYGSFLTESNFCAGLRNGTSVCHGDSGGSMTFEEDGAYYIRGIVSSSPSKINQTTQQLNCDTMQYAIYTDVAKFLQWISVNSGINCQTILRCDGGTDRSRRSECEVDVHIKSFQRKCEYIFDETSGSIVRSLTIGGELEILPDLSDAGVKFENLENLRFYNIKLKTIERMRLTAFRKIRVLKLSYNQIAQLDVNTFKGLDKLTTIDLDTNKLEMLPEGLLSDNHQLQEIDLDRNRLKELHANLFRDNKKLERISLSKNLISELEGNILAELHNLTDIFLDENQLEILPEGLFRNNQKMELIYLDGNRLKELHVDVFRGLHNLAYIHLNANKLDILPQGLFCDNHRLQRVQLNQNQLSELHVDVFKGLHNLEEVLLHDNRLKILPEDIFRDNHLLQSIDLYENQLSELHVDVFKGLHNLKIVFLQNNQLRILPEGIFRDNHQLHRIYLYENQLKEIHFDVFKGLHNITNIHLDGNKVEDLPKGLFRDNHQLQEIILSENLLKELHSDVFNGLHNLNFLYLNKNQLETLPQGIFRDNRNLIVIGLYKNRIMRVETDFSNFPKLTELEMRENVCVNELFDTSFWTLGQINSEIRKKCSN